MHTFYALREVLFRTKIIIIYYSLVESILRYCIIQHEKGNIILQLYTLQVTQNTILKTTFKKRKLFTTTRLYKVNDILDIKILFIIYQCIQTVYNSPDIFKFKQTRLIRSIIGHFIPGKETVWKEMFRIQFLTA